MMEQARAAPFLIRALVALVGALARELETTKPEVNRAETD